MGIDGLKMAFADLQSAVPKLGCTRLFDSMSFRLNHQICSYYGRCSFDLVKQWTCRLIEDDQ